MAVTITQTANPAGVAATSNIATYTDTSIGAAAPNRIVVVLVGTELSSSTPSACTIDYGSGDTAMNAGTGGNQGISFSQLYYLAVPTGTTATIKVTYSSTDPGATSNHIAVYRVIGGTFSSTGSDASTDMDSTNPLTTGSTTIEAGGGMIAIASCGADTQAKTWANLNEDIDADVGTFRFTTATSTTAGTAERTCTGTGNGEDGALSWIIFADNASPTVALNSPADASSDSDTTPTLDFTGTDTESNDIRYNVQVSTATFSDPAIRASSKNDSTTGTAISVSAPTGTTTGDFVVVIVHGNGQTTIVDNNGGTPFTEDINDYQPNPTNGHTISIFSRTIQGGDPSTYNFTLGASGRWAVIAICFNGEHAYDVSPSTTNFANEDSAADGTHTAPSFDLVSHPTIVITFCGWDTGSTGTITTPTNYTLLENANSGGEPLHASYRAFSTPTATGAIDHANTEFGAKITGSFSVKRKYLLDKVSGTDAGFANPDVGGDTDPFTSGDNIQYTVQSALSETTHYWRVGGVDPSGSNTYGAWSSTRSFTIDTGGAPPPAVKEIFMTTNRFFGS